MVSGEVNFNVTSGEGGNNLYIKVIDEATGDPITQGVCITGQWNAGAVPKNWLGQDECSPASGTSISLFTDKDGVAEWAFPGTCPGAFSLIAQTPNYQDELIQFNNGTISGPVNVQIAMSKGTMGQLAQAPPACLSLAADLGQTGYTTGGGVAGAAGSAGNFVETLGLYGAVAAIAIAIVIAVVFAARGSH